MHICMYLCITSNWCNVQKFNRTIIIILLGGNKHKRKVQDGSFPLKIISNISSSLNENSFQAMYYIY